MTSISSPPSPPLTTDEELVEFLDQLLQEAIRPQTWFLFLDEEDRLMPAMMPIDDLPADPLHGITVDDLGECTAAELFASRFAMIQAQIDASRILLVWERPGSRRLTDQDREWARLLGQALVDAGADLRGQLLLSTNGHRVIAPDELRR